MTLNITWQFFDQIYIKFPIVNSSKIKKLPFNINPKWWCNHKRWEREKSKSIIKSFNFVSQLTFTVTNSKGQ